jgi:hypothetical protein
MLEYTVDIKYTEKIDVTSGAIVSGFKLTQFAFYIDAVNLKF